VAVGRWVNTDLQYGFETAICNLWVPVLERWHQAKQTSAAPSETQNLKGSASKFSGYSAL
jgi:hypothetical protein